AVVSFDGAPYFVFRDMLDSLSPHTVSIADMQLSSDGRTRYRFLPPWSDGGAATHMITGQPQGGTLTAPLARDRQLVYVASNNNGLIDVSPAAPSGSYVPEGTAITLTATVDATAGYIWRGWLGDTLSRNTRITLPMNRPYAVRAVFLQPLTADGAILLAVKGPAPITSASLPAGSGLRLFAGPLGADSAKFALTGTLANGPILVVGVADVNRVASYNVFIRQVAANDYTLRSLTGYGVTVSR